MTGAPSMVAVPVTSNPSAGSSTKKSVLPSSARPSARLAVRSAVTSILASIDDADQIGLRAEIEIEVPGSHAPREEVEVEFQLERTVVGIGADTEGCTRSRGGADRHVAELSERVRGGSPFDASAPGPPARSPGSRAGARPQPAILHSTAPALRDRAGRSCCSGPAPSRPCWRGTRPKGSSPRRAACREFSPDSRSARGTRRARR